MSIALWSAATAISAVAIYIFAIPVSVNMTVDMQKASLPCGNSVSIIIDGAEYIATTTHPEFNKITVPGYRRFSDISISASSPFYNTLDTTVTTGLGICKNVCIMLLRDSSFATFAGNVYDTEMQPLEGVVAEVSGHRTRTDVHGRFSLTLPLSEQRTQLPIRLTKLGYTPVERSDESPDRDLKFIMHTSL